MITVASYNIRKGIGTDRRRNPHRILDVIEEIGADVIALQEADRRFGLRATALPLDMMAAREAYHPVPFETRPHSIGWHGNAILVKNGHEVIDHEVIRIPSLEPRGAVRADIRIAGNPVRFVAMHLDLSGLWRKRQARHILAHLEKLDDGVPTVLMGDLNEWSLTGGCLSVFGECLRVAHTPPSFHARRPIGRLDRIMVSETIHIAAAGAHRSESAMRASDHLPVWARLHIDV
jgi:endonuclease/exonuclease/phosphatase family metal-dependent hydrolase